MKYSKIKQRTLFCVGDSFLHNFDKFMSERILATLLAAGKNVNKQDYGVAGWTIADLVSDYSNWSYQIKPNDLVYCGIGTNDIWASGLTAAQTYSALASYITPIQSTGAKVAIVTMIARQTDATKEATRLAYNSLIRGNSLFAPNAISDPALDSNFNSTAVTSNTAYYLADTIHPNNTTPVGGMQLMVDSYSAPALISIW